LCRCGGCCRSRRSRAFRKKSYYQSSGAKSSAVSQTAKHAACIFRVVVVLYVPRVVPLTKPRAGTPPPEQKSGNGAASCLNNKPQQQKGKQCSFPCSLLLTSSARTSLSFRETDYVRDFSLNPPLVVVQLPVCVIPPISSFVETTSSSADNKCCIFWKKAPDDDDDDDTRKVRRPSVVVDHRRRHYPGTISSTLP